MPGAHIDLPTSGGTVHLNATAVSAVPLRRLEIVQNGRVIADSCADCHGSTTLTISEELSVDASSWIAARCSTDQEAQFLLPTLNAAHTSPVYLTCGDPQTFDPETSRYFQTTLQGGLDWLNTLATVESPELHEQIKEVFLDAMDQLRSEMQ